MKRIFAGAGTLALAAALAGGLTSCSGSTTSTTTEAGGGHAAPSSSGATPTPQQSSATPTASDAPTPQQQLASALVGMTNTVGSTVTSATVGVMCSESQGPASSGPYSGCTGTNDNSFTQEPATTWQKSGTVSLASGEITFSDGTQIDASICVDGSGAITWGDFSGGGMCILTFTPSPAYEATQPASIMAPWIASPASNFALGDNIPGGSILDNDLGTIQNMDENLGGEPAGNPGWAVLQNLGKKLTADADAALSDPMPPIDPADYRAAASGYASAGVYMSHLDMTDYNAATKAALGYFTKWMNSWDG